MDDVEVALTHVGTLSEQGAEEPYVALLLSLVDKAVNEDLMDDPCLVVHIFLVGVDLLREKFFNDLLHLHQRCEFKSFLLSVEEDLTRQKTPEDLKQELVLLLSSKNLLQSKQVLFGI